MKEKTYRVPQNVWFMIKLAWTSGEKKVLVLGLLSALLAVALNLARLYISPAVLAVLEKQASLTELLKTIGGFVLVTLLLSAAAAYVDVNTLHGRVTVRQEIMNLLNRKAATTSYPNVDDEKFRKLLTKASECVSSNNQATGGGLGNTGDTFDGWNRFSDLSSPSDGCSAHPDCCDSCDSGGGLSEPQAGKWL